MSITKQPKERLTLEQVASRIKRLISRSALAKIEIGELLIKYISDIEHGGKANFYESIGMTERTAQHYMQIASNEKVQELKEKGELDGLNMSAILNLVGMCVKTRGVNNDNAPQQVQEYVSVGFENFDISKRHTLGEYKVEYVALSSKVLELEAKLAEHEGKVATNS